MFWNSTEREEGEDRVSKPKIINQMATVRIHCNLFKEVTLKKYIVHTNPLHLQLSLLRGGFSACLGCRYFNKHNSLSDVAAAIQTVGSY